MRYDAMMEDLNETVVDERIKFLQALAEIHHESKMVYDAVYNKKIDNWRLLEKEFRKLVLNLLEEPHYNAATPKGKSYQSNLENAGLKLLHEYRVLLKEPELDWEQAHNLTRIIESDIGHDVMFGRVLSPAELQISDVLSKVIQSVNKRSLELFRSQVHRLERIMQVNSLPALENF